MNRSIALLLVLSTAPVVVITAEAAEDDSIETARVHVQKGRVEEALEVYEALEKTKADPVKIAIGKSRAYEADGRWKEATQLLAAGVKDSPKSDHLWARLAEVQFRQGRYIDAEKNALKALKLNARHPRAKLVLADVYTETGRIKQADEAYHWFIGYYNSEQPEDAERLMLVARGAAQHARWNSGSSTFNFVVSELCPDALKNDRHYWQAYHISGSLLLEKFNRAQAIPEFKQALAINPRAADVLVALGRAALQQYDLEQADEYATRALAVNPTMVRALLLAGDVKILSGEFTGARILLGEALSVNPHEQRTLGRLAACYLLEDGLPPDARMNELLSNLDAVDNVKIENPGRFVQLTVELAKRNPHPGYFLNIVGQTLEGRRRYAAAETLYKHAMTVMPQLSEPKTSLGMLYMHMGRTKEAAKLLDEAFKADPFHIRVSNLRRVVAVLNEYKAISTEHFVIHVDNKADAILGRYMAEYLEEIYPELVKQFGFEPPQRTRFEIYHDAKGISAHEWFSARMVGLPWIQTIGASTGMIVALSSPTASKKPYNWARVLKHEFVHIITMQQTDFNIPHWFTEALAVSAEGYPRPELWDRLLLERVPAGDLRTLANLDDGFRRPRSSDDWQFAYCQSRLYAQYLVGRYGRDSIRKLLEAYRKNTPTEKAIAEVCGVEIETFEKGYRVYLDQLVSTLADQQPVQKKSPAEIEKAHRADPGDPQLAAAYAQSLLQLRKRRQARKLALKALKTNAQEPLAALVLAKLEMRAQDVESAIAFLERALNRKKPHKQVLALLAEIKLADEQFPEAVTLFELGHRAFPSDVTFTRGLAAACLKTNQTEKLTEALKALAELDFDDAGVRRKLAELALKQGAFPQAAAHAKSALHIDVLDVETHRILAEAHLGRKQPARAVREFETALVLKPNDVGLELRLAKALLAAGRPADAESKLNSILEREPGNSAAAGLLKRLKQLPKPKSKPKLKSKPKPKSKQRERTP